MEKGTYKGFYKFDNEAIGQALDSDKTYFTIEITESDGHNFCGWVEDDLLSGGTEGRGTITGKLYSDGITFTKDMPYLTVLSPDPLTGVYVQRVDKTKAHKPIYYDGVGNDGERFEGRWGFKYGIMDRLVIWVRALKMGGTWEMTKVKV